MYLYYVGKYASTQNWVLEERERERAFHVLVIECD